MTSLETISLSRRTVAYLETHFSANCLKILELQTPGTLSACTGNALPFILQTLERIFYVASEKDEGKLRK
jgi:hypothetical protein